MFRKIFSVILTAAFLVNVSTAALSYDIIQQDTLRSRASTGTLAQEQIERSIKASSSGLADRHTAESMAKQIQDLLESVIHKIHTAETISDESSGADIQGYINMCNSKKSYDIIENSPNGIQAAPTYFVEDLQDNDAAIKALIEGKLCLQMPFAGAGSRMSSSLEKEEGIETGDKPGQIPEKDLKLANINIWQIAVAMGKKRYDQYIKEGKTHEEAQRLIEEEGLITEKPLYAQDIGFAERHMIALEQGILNLKIPLSQKGEIFKNLKLIVSISDDIKDDIMLLFKHNSRLTGEPFFSLNSSNVVFVEGGYGTAYKIDKNNEIMQTDKKTSWNHGFAFEELAWITSSDDPKNYKVYTLKDGKQNPIDRGASVFEYVIEKGAEFSVIHRINDLMLMHPDMALDIQMFGAFLNFKQSQKGIGANVFLEMVANPTGQKGGMALTVDGQHLMLFEGLNTNDRLVKDKLDEIAAKMLLQTDGRMGVPYNRLYGFFEIKSVIKALISNGGMPLSVTYKNGEISPEIPTGDITLLQKHGIYAYAVQRYNDRFIDEGLASKLLNEHSEPILAEEVYKRDSDGKGTGAIIHDCKQAKYIPSGREFLDALDNPNFKLPNGKPFFIDRYYPTKASSAGVSLSTKDLEHINLAAEIANLSDATGTIVYNDTSLSLKQQKMFQSLIGTGTPGLAELEAKLGCNVRLMSQGNIADNANTMIISTEKLDKFKKTKYFITEQTQIDTSYVAIAPLIAIAKGLLGLESQTEQPELYTALKNSIKSLSQGLLNERDIEQAITAYINGNPMFIKLPLPTSYDYDQLEQLQRQALMVLIAA